jgi:phosphate transport system permease protein
VELKQANQTNSDKTLVMGEGANRLKRVGALAGHGLLLSVTSLSAIAVLFIFYFVFRDALPFFKESGRLAEFFTGTSWYPSAREPHFGSLPVILGSVLVTAGAILFSAPLGLAAALCLSDVLSFSTRQVAKPVIEMLAAIPSVAYGFFALVVMAPLFQNEGGKILAGFCALICFPLLLLLVIVLGDLLSTWIQRDEVRVAVRVFLTAAIGIPAFWVVGIWVLHISEIHIASGTNALNASIILGIMALPTIVSVSGCLVRRGTRFARGQLCDGRHTGRDTFQGGGTGCGQRNSGRGVAWIDASRGRDDGGVDGGGQCGSDSRPLV